MDIRIRNGDEKEVYINDVKDKIEKKITNADFGRGEWHDIEIANHELYSHPNRKYHYDVDLHDLTADIYVMNAKPLTGIFENITFKKNTFFDCAVFKGVIFKNCTFDGFSIRWCKFEKCQFIDCKGTIGYARKATWKKDCIFENTDIRIDSIDEYIYINSKRYDRGYYNIALK